MTKSIYRAKLSETLDIAITETHLSNNVSTNMHLTFQSAVDLTSFLSAIKNKTSLPDILKNPHIQKLFALFDISEGAIKLSVNQSGLLELIIRDKKNNNVQWELSLVSGKNKADNDAIDIFSKVLQDFSEAFINHRRQILQYKNPSWLKYYKVEKQLLTADKLDPKVQALFFLQNQTSHFTDSRSMMSALFDMLNKIYRYQSVNSHGNDMLHGLSQLLPSLDDQEDYSDQIIDLVEKDPVVKTLMTRVGLDIKQYAGECKQIRPSFLHEMLGNRLTHKLDNQNALLDLGAGLGSDSIFFSSQGFHVTAVDVSERAKHHFDLLCPENAKNRIDYQLMDLNDKSHAGYLEDLIHGHLYIIAVRALKYLDSASCERVLAAIIDYALVGARVIIVDEIMEESKTHNLARTKNGIASFFAPRIDWRSDRPAGWKDNDTHQLNVFQRIA